MQFETDAKAFASAVSACAPLAQASLHAVSAKHVLVTANGGDVSVSATDLLTSATYRVATDGTKTGSVMCPAKDLLARLRHIPGDAHVALKKGEVLHISDAANKRRKYQLRCLPAADFPKVPTPDGESVSVESKVLSQLIAATSFAVNTEDSRGLPTSNALLEFPKGRIRMIATDGHRMSVCDLERNGKARDSFCVPRRALGEVARLAQSGSVDLHVGDRLASFAAGANAISSSMPTTKFPPYESVLNSSMQGREKFASVERSRILDGVKAMAATDNVIYVAIAANAITLRAQSQDHGESEDLVSCEYDGPPGGAHMVARFLLDAIGACDSETIELSVAGDMDPIIVRGGSTTGIVMPRRP